MEPIKIFEAVEYLEKPKCPKCGTNLDYGLTTTYHDRKQLHICNSCGKELK